MTDAEEFPEEGIASLSPGACLFVNLGPQLPLAVFLLRLPHFRARLSSQP